MTDIHGSLFENIKWLYLKVKIVSGCYSWSSLFTRHLMSDNSKFDLSLDVFCLSQTVGRFGFSFKNRRLAVSGRLTAEATTLVYFSHVKPKCFYS